TQLPPDIHPATQAQAGGRSPRPGPDRDRRRPRLSAGPAAGRRRLARTFLAMPEELVHRHGTLPGDERVVIARRRVRLPRMLGPPALFSACYGNVGSSIYYALGVTAAFALGLTPLAMLLAGGIFVTTALNYAEGTSAIPVAGGSSSFARRAFNET